MANPTHNSHPKKSAILMSSNI